MSSVTPEIRGAIKLKQALDFCRYTGSADSFRVLFPSARKGAGDKHNIYTPADIRRARIKLMDANADAARGPTLPPVMFVRMTRGGVGKTTIAGNVAATMACMGHRVLLIDADPQASLTAMFGIDWANEDVVHIGRLLKDFNDERDIDWASAVRPIYGDGMLDLIASDITLANVESWLSGNEVKMKETLVDRLFKDNLAFLSHYDCIVIDTAPSTSHLSNALMYASRKVLAVVKPDGSTLKAMEVLSHNIGEMHRAFKSEGLKIGVRIVANAYDARIGTCRVSLETLRATYEGLIDPNVIPSYASFVRQVDLFDDAKSGPVLEREPLSAAAKAIIDLTRSLIGFYDVQLAGMIPVVPDVPRRSRQTSKAVA